MGDAKSGPVRLSFNPQGGAQSRGRPGRRVPGPEGGGGGARHCRRFDPLENRIIDKRRIGRREERSSRAAAE